MLQLQYDPKSGDNEKSLIPVHYGYQSESYEQRYLYFGQLNESNETFGIVRGFSSDSLFEGQFKDGKGEGWCRLIYADGDYSIGWFEGDRMNGYGICYSGGQVEEGIFEND